VVRWRRCRRKLANLSGQKPLPVVASGLAAGWPAPRPVGVIKPRTGVPFGSFPTTWWGSADTNGFSRLCLVMMGIGLGNSYGIACCSCSRCRSYGISPSRRKCLGIAHLIALSKFFVNALFSVHAQGGHRYCLPAWVEVPRSAARAGAAPSVQCPSAEVSLLYASMFFLYSARVSFSRAYG